MKKKKKRIIIAGSVLAVAAAAGVGGFLFLRSKRTMPQMSTSVQTAQAETGNISTTVVGTGTLASAGTTDIKVPVGLEIEEVLVASGDTVTTGETLATISLASIAEKILSVKEEISTLQEEIEANDTSEAKETIIIQQADLTSLENLLTTLEGLLEDNTIKATFDGTVDTVSVSEGSETSKSSGASSSSGSTSTNGSASGSGVTQTSSGNTTTGSFITLSSSNNSSTASGTDASMVYSDYEVVDSSTAEAVDAEIAAASVESDSSEIAASTDTLTELTKIRACAPNITAPVTGAAPQTGEISAAEYSGTIQWNTSDSTFQANTVYSATLQLTSNEGYYFTSDVAVNYSGATVNILSQEGESEGNKITFTLTFPSTATAASATPTPSGSSESSSDKTTAASGSESASGSTSGAASGSTSSGSADSSTSGSSSSDTSSSSSSEENDTHTTVAFSIAPSDSVMLSVSVDELDILSIALDQSAAVTFDALEDQEFTGTITSIADSATTSSGGVSKYAVEISLPKDDSMKLGMNASATITVEDKENVVLIPVNALQEKGDKTYVYTSYDEATSQLGDMTEIETGLSDGDNVEVTSGLTDGTTVYYEKVGVSSSDSSDSKGGMGDMGGNMSDMGGSPPSGSMGGSQGNGGGPGGMGGN